MLLEWLLNWISEAKSVAFNNAYEIWNIRNYIIEFDQMDWEKKSENEGDWKKIEKRRE